MFPGIKLADNKCMNSNLKGLCILDSCNWMQEGDKHFERVREGARGIVSERFHNSQNENDMNYKNSHRMKFF